MDTISQVIKAAKDAVPTLEYRLDEPMKDHTTFKIGGTVRSMFFPRNAVELAELHRLIYEYKIHTLVIGNGSNILINDRPIDIVVIKTAGLNTASRISDKQITAGAGVSLTELSEFACKNGLSGLEFAYGIPGSLGGAVSMNAGAYGSEMKDIVRSTAAYSPGNGMITVTGEQHGFSYRSSRFSNTDDIVISSDIQLQKGDEESIRAKMDELSARRRESQPLEMPSAGSTFKRPKDGFAAALIEQSGLKGVSIGGAQVSEKHAGFIVNRSEATFTDVIRLIEHVQETVLRRFGTVLEPEIKIVR